jgi:hypothetical protein
MFKYLILLVALLFCSCGGTGETEELRFRVEKKYELYIPDSDDPLEPSFDVIYKIHILVRKPTGEYEKFYAIPCSKKDFDSMKEDSYYIGVFQSYWKYEEGEYEWHTTWYLRLLEFKGEA